MNNHDTYIFAHPNRRYAYIVIYLGLLYIVNLLAQVLVYLPFRYFPNKFWEFVYENFSTPIRIGAALVYLVLIWNKINKTPEPNYWSVYKNYLEKGSTAIVYQSRFEIGNIFEVLVMHIKLFKIEDTTPDDKPRGAKALNDVLRVWATVLVQPRDPSFLLLGETEAARTKAALALAWTAVISLIEEYTASKDSDESVGKATEITAYVASRIDTYPSLVKNGVYVSAAIKDIGESEKAEKARARVKDSEQFRKSIEILASDKKTFMKDGKYVDGAITEEEAAAIALANEGQGSFKRDIKETIIHVKGDPKVLEALKGTGLLVGAIEAETGMGQEGPNDSN